MSKTNEQIANLSTQIGNLTYVIEQLTDSLNKTDDFNNWSYADSFASIANSLVKANSLHKTELNKKTSKPFADLYLGSNEHKQHIQNINDEWFEQYPYMKFTHSKKGKWEPITEDMRVRALAAARITRLYDEKEIQFLKDLVGNPDFATDLTEGQVGLLNALLYKFYTKDKKVA